MKATIREEMLTKRKSMDPADIAWRNTEITEHLRMCDGYVDAKKVLFYLPMQNEVDVTPLLADVAVKHLLPYIEDDEIKASLITDPEDLVAGPHGTKEPRVKERDEYFDVVLVPGVAFDKQKNRIGYGKGYYDKFLATTTAYKIGLAYQNQIVPLLPTEDHDVPMDIVITEEGIIL
ncbi:MAG: 5-formyltetrahydrofolate cyclo-ligase [Candidatus Woesearchaeota archaeon]|nr:5-formyltetrahydrofolate cyclo-ligase [Candidatus Woesearchaeota archaeon]